MIFWALACASHGFAGGVIALAASRLLLGVGEGGGFPAATRAVAEWFPVNDRATAMGIINAGTAVGAVVAPPLIAVVLTNANWFGLAPWRWVFFLTGALGLLWTLWWWRSYFVPENSNRISETQAEPKISLAELFGTVYGQLEYGKDYRDPGARLTDVVETRSGVVTVDADGAIFGGGVYDGWMYTDIHETDTVRRPLSISFIHPDPKEVLIVGMSGGAWSQLIANHPQVEKVIKRCLNPNPA